LHDTIKAIFSTILYVQKVKNIMAARLFLYLDISKQAKPTAVKNNT